MSAALGTRLRALGLSPRGLAAWAGTDRISALPRRLPQLATREPVPAAAALALLVAGAELSIDETRRLPIDELVELELVEHAGPRVRARVAVVPVGPSLVVCDRADAAAGPELVCWPDDSSLHLVGCLPAGRVAHWLDLGTGSAFAPLARPELGAQITGIDLNPRAVAYSRLGAALSGISHLTLVQADVGASWPAAALVSCNAPMPVRGPRLADDELWRYTTDAFFARLVDGMSTRVAPGGLAVIHAVLDALPIDALAGERIAVAYAGSPRFGVLWWRPHAAPRVVVAQRALTPERPHLEAQDRDDARSGALSSGP